MEAQISLLDTREAQTRVDAHPFWYHTIDVAPGVVTAGWFDLRRALEMIPFPDVRGSVASTDVAVLVREHASRAYIDWFNAHPKPDRSRARWRVTLPSGS